MSSRAADLRAIGPLACALLIACASGPHAPAVSAPSWWPKPPQSEDALYFAGEAEADDEATARPLAQQAALRALESELGVTVASRCRDVVGQRGTAEIVEVECTTTIAGAARTLRGIRLEKLESGPSGDGDVRAYALLSWPRAEKAALLAADAARGQRALERFAEAERLTAARDYQGARLAIDEARTAIGQTEIPLDHPTHRTSALLASAMTSLEARIAAEEKAHTQVCLAGIRCLKDGAQKPCKSSRGGVLRASISSAGRQLAPHALPAATLDALLDGQKVAADAARMDARCLVGVQLTSELIEAGKPFTFVRVAARAVLYDSAAAKIVWSEELDAEKVGHTSYDEAMEKGFDQLEKTVASRVKAALERAR